MTRRKGSETLAADHSSSPNPRRFLTVKGKVYGHGPMHDETVKEFARVVDPYSNWLEMVFVYGPAV